MSTETQTSPEVEHSARNLGWVPEAEWRGDKAKWVDAETFTRRGEEIMPLLKKNNQELQARVDASQAEVKRLNDLFKASQESIEELKKFQTEETKRQVASARKDLLAELKAAKKAGDTDLEVDLQEAITELDKREKAVVEPKEIKKEDPPQNVEGPATSPEFVAWRRDNTWFDSDLVRQATAIGIAQKLRADPANAHLVGRAFFDFVGQEVSAIFDKTTRGTSKVEGAGGGGGAGGSTRVKGFSDLPPDAKAVCERQAAKLVGQGRAFKDTAAWQKHYAQVYFASEE
jgi:hypothetical protein